MKLYREFRTQEEIDEQYNPVYNTKPVEEIFESIGLGD